MLAAIQLRLAALKLLMLAALRLLSKQMQIADEQRLSDHLVRQPLLYFAPHHYPG